MTRCAPGRRETRSEHRSLAPWRRGSGGRRCPLAPSPPKPSPVPRWTACPPSAPASMRWWPLRLTVRWTARAPWIPPACRQAAGAARRRAPWRTRISIIAPAAPAPAAPSSATASCRRRPRWRWSASMPPVPSISDGCIWPNCPLTHRLQRPSRPWPQPLEPRPLLGRLLFRVRCGGGRAAGGGLAGVGHGRLHPPSRRHVRHYRPQAHSTALCRWRAPCALSPTLTRSPPDAERAGRGAHPLGDRGADARDGSTLAAPKRDYEAGADGDLSGLTIAVPAGYYRDACHSRHHRLADEA